MRPDVETATARVIAVRARLAELPGGVPLQEIEDELCSGYALALEGDAWLAEMEKRVQALLHDASLDARLELRSVARRHADFQRTVVGLRRELAVLRQEHDRLRADAPARAGTSL